MRSDLNKGFDPFLFAAGEEDTKDALREYVRFFQNCREVLDLATGRGYFLDLLASAGLDGCGVDHDPELVRRGVEQGMKLEEANVLDYLNTTTRTFEGIMASHIIEHFSPDDGLSFLRLAAERLAPGGTLVVVTPNVRNDDVHRTVSKLDLDHKCLWPLELLQSQVQRFGLVPINGGSSRVALKWYIRSWRNHPKTQLRALIKRTILYGMGFNFLLGDTFIVARKPAA